jgi:hypothetical protein
MIDRQPGSSIERPTRRVVMGNRLHRRGRYLTTPFGPVFTSGEDREQITADRLRLRADENQAAIQRHEYRQREQRAMRGVCPHCGGKTGGTERHQIGCPAL